VDPLKGIKRRIANAWVGHLQRVANKHAEEVRELQAETGRNRRLLIRFDAFEHDVTRRGFIDQEVYTYFVRVDEGRVEIARGADAWDGQVMTDVPTLIGLQQGRMVKVVNGADVVIQPWTPKRAWFAGRILTNGDATMLSNLLLMERRVWEELLHEIKSAAPPN
jgi:hypothetical protein